MDFKRAVEDLNSDIEKTFPYVSPKDSSRYSYLTDGRVTKIFFHKIEIFNSEIDKELSYRNPHGQYISMPIENMSFEDFEDFLEMKVTYIGIDFIKCSFSLNPKYQETEEGDANLDSFINKFFKSYNPWQKIFLKQMINNDYFSLQRQILEK